MALHRHATERRLIACHRRNGASAAPLDELDLEGKSVVLPKDLLDQVLVGGHIRAITSQTSGRVLTALLRRQVPAPVKAAIPARDVEQEEKFVFCLTGPVEPCKPAPRHYFIRFKGRVYAERILVNGNGAH